MKIITLESLPFKAVISGLAEFMNTEVNESLGEYTVVLPKEYGIGEITGINFPNGVGMIRYKCTFNQDVILKFEENEIHPLKFMYCAEQTIGHRFQGDDEWREVQKWKFAIVASTDRQGHELRFTENTKANLVSIEIDRQKFSDQFDYELSGIDPIYYQLLGDLEAKRRVYHEGYYNLNASLCIEDMEKFEGDDMLKTSFFGSKSLEMFTYMLEQYRVEINEEPVDRLRLVDLKTLQYAEAYLEEHYSEKLSVDQLARVSGTNSVQLQRSFRAKHQKTVNQYLTDFRLSVAVDLLKSKEHSIEEIADMVGIKSRSHFTLLFRTRFGVTPRKYQQKND